jgi:4-hydroxymandelate oxidase
MAPLDLTTLEAAAASVLPADVFDFLAGGSGDEVTLAANRSAWDAIALRPRVLRDVSVVDTSTTVLGHPVAAPILVAPVAYQRLAHPGGEAETAAGAARAGSLMVVSTRASVPIEEVAAAAGPGAWWQQVYVLRDRGWTEELVLRAAAAGCAALVVTVDAPFLGRKRRDERNGFQVPDDASGRRDAEGARQDPALTFDDLAWLGGLTELPLVVKGVLRGADGLRCVEAGAAALVVSNHGGRQLDGAVATAVALPEVAAAVGGSAELYVDGGIRSGVDVLRALALGARAVLVGRPAVYGLATGGAAGVAAVLDALAAELREAFALAGVPSCAEATPDLAGSF